MKAQIDAAIKQDIVRPNEGMRLLQEFERGLKDQTYLGLCFLRAGPGLVSLFGRLVPGLPGGWRWGGGLIFEKYSNT